MLWGIIGRLLPPSRLTLLQGKGAEGQRASLLEKKGKIVFKLTTRGNMGGGNCPRGVKSGGGAIWCGVHHGIQPKISVNDGQSNLSGGGG